MFKLENGWDFPEYVSLDLSMPSLPIDAKQEEFLFRCQFLLN